MKQSKPKARAAKPLPLGARVAKDKKQGNVVSYTGRGATRRIRVRWDDGTASMESLKGLTVLDKVEG